MNIKYHIQNALVPKSGRLLLALLSLSWAAQAPAQADPLGQAVDTTIQSNRAARESQNKVNQLDDQTRQLLERYRSALWQSQQLNVYAQQLEEIAAGQEAEKVSLRRQLSELDRTERELLPLILRMLDSLEQFVSLDIPFLSDERGERIAALKRLMADPEASTGEKFRRVLEAYQIEVDYGRGLAAERAEVDDKVVEILRVGRIGLFALTLDGGEALFWSNGQWQPLPHRYIKDVRQGLRVAREIAAPSLLVLPMPAATGVAP